MLKNTISVRCQSILIILMALLWALSCFGWLFEMQSQRLFWTAAFVFLPFIMLLFGIILFFSHKKANQKFKWLVFTALACVSIPWVIFIVIFFETILEMYSTNGL